MKLSQDLTINAPVDRVWGIVAHDFDKIGEWASGVAHSTTNAEAVIPDGASVGGRVCSVPGFGDIHETFTAYDEEGKTFTYDATGLPFFVRRAENGWTIKAVGANRTRVSFSADMTLMPVIGTLMGIPMKSQMTKLLKNAVEELKHYAETGEIHPRKKALIEKEMGQLATSS
ncbi:MAG: SRPBCC family protein [Chloroflexota bacterium]